MTIDLRNLARSHTCGILWGQASEDLNVNLVALAPGGAIEEHINAVVDVLLVGVRGEGTISVDGVVDVFGLGRLLVVPKGARRAVSASSEGLTYLTCHRRRPGLQPGPLRRGDQGALRDVQSGNCPT
jgi:mannose-6-phosphate isomerase-like protein (cupin superfamily)